MVTQEDIAAAIDRLEELFPTPADPKAIGENLPRFELSQGVKAEVWNHMDSWQGVNNDPSIAYQNPILRRSPMAIETLLAVHRKNFLKDKYIRSVILDQAVEIDLNGVRRKAIETGLISDMEEWDLTKDNLPRLANPGKWMKGRKCRAFLETLGFPLSFEPSQSIPPTPYYSRLPWAPYPPPEDYQLQVSELVGRVLRREYTSEAGTNRGLVALPTGAGKTRVTVSALLRWFVESEEPPLILWICHSKELAQQAEESIRRSWKAMCHDLDLTREEQRDLRLHSFWSDTGWSGESGITQDPINNSEGGIAICLIQTLKEIATSNGQMGDDHEIAFRSLSNPSAVIIDEAHRFETRTYRQILDKLGIQVRITARDPSPIPIIGLTATPWKENIFPRYDRVLLPELVSTESPKAEDVKNELHRIRRVLVDDEILSRAHYRPLNLDLEIKLTKSDVDDFGKLSNSILERLAKNTSRGSKIIDDIVEIMGSGAWKSMIVYTITVDQAEALSAELSRRGITSAPISGKTPRSERAETISLFRGGKLQVICNHSVLTVGFDAPNTDVIYITRPVYSPTMLEQIVGRGLRGTKFGGTDKCLVVTPQERLLSSRIGSENIILAEDEIRRRIVISED